MLAHVRAQRALTLVWLCCALLGLTSCAQPGSVGPIGTGPEAFDEARFDSEDPGRPWYGGDGDGDGDGDRDGDGDSVGPDALATIAEADVIQLNGDRLYALSRTFGLSVIDVSDVAHLKLLGRTRLAAMPREMYVLDGVVLALVDGERRFTEVGEDVQVEQTSQLLVLDASDPLAITTVDEHAFSGGFLTSRVIGGVLYLVTTDETPSTTVTSFDVADPLAPQQRQTLRYEVGPGEYGYGGYTIAVTTQRIYVAGPNPASSDGSEIQVIDIADGTGEMGLGAKVSVQGKVTNRWQMDEHEGVLRVVTQLNNGYGAPIVETFRIVSSDELTPLGSTLLELPREELLRSVRFDGDRAYAITFERTDPLFTIDLSDPAHPRQAGMLEMPGWVMHMEPRGDRVIGIGYDASNAEGSLNVSLFDVSDMSAPRMIERVSFGGSSGQFAEPDPNYAHQGFTILDQLGLIMVPFTSYSEVDEFACQNAQRNGVQLVDFAHDDLTSAGVAPVHGAVRRALVVDDRLLSVSDDHVEAFDISTDAPRLIDDVALGRYVRAARMLDSDHVVRLAQAGSSARYVLDVVDRDDTASLTSDAAIELDLGRSDAASDGCDAPLETQLVIDPPYVHVAYLLPNGGTPTHGIATVSFDDLEAPELVANTLIGGRGIDATHAELTAIAGGFIELSTQEAADGSGVEAAQLNVVDLSDPADPVISSLDVPMPARELSLHARGATAYVGRLVQLSEDTVRSFVEPIDLSALDAPKLEDSIVVPGMLRGLVGDQRVITVSHELERDPTRTVSCDTLGPRAGYYAMDGDKEICSVWRERIHLVRIDGDVAVPEASERIARDSEIEAIDVTDERVFVTLDDWARNSRTPENILSMMVISGMAKGALDVHRLRTDGDLSSRWYAASVTADGTRALARQDWPSQVALIDTADPANPTAIVVAAPQGIDQLTLGASNALCAVGIDGVVEIAFP